MIEIKKCNYFTGDNSISDGIKDIVNFLELSGRNYLLLTPPKNSDIDKSTQTNTIKYYLDNQLHFNNFVEFVDIIENEGNLFRVDLLVLDFWHLTPIEISIWKKEIDKLGLDHLIIAKEYHYKSTDDVTDYHLRREYKTVGKNELFITDNINKWTSTLESLIKSYRRDKKINDIFGGTDN
jgi:hypothetical protein